MSFITEKLSNFASGSAKSRVLAQSDNDVVIVVAVRSAITKVRLFIFTRLHPYPIPSISYLNTNTLRAYRARRVVSKTPGQKRSFPKSSRLLTPRPDLTPNSSKTFLSEMCSPPVEVLPQRVWLRSLLESLIQPPSTPSTGSARPV